ncbi:MAG: protein kinase domain-containing protein [Bryobacteraceae bacterium]
MTDERWRQIDELFTRAVAVPAADRAAFLASACGGDRELHREVESLLACDAPDEELIEISTGLRESVASTLAGGTTALEGRRAGPYRLTRLVGQGGMGAVYQAVRDDDVYQKHVAVKLLKRGMDTDVMLARFRRERQILAKLEHPFIARLMDGGATEDGLPYFVMEYVDGIPITTYCRERNFSIPERLRLFRLVCEAVQFAHQNLVIHRDIKPSNILATREGIPKLLDFGIAKALEPGASGEMTATQREFRMFTPDYASPEQVRGSSISTATDIYSLGAVLYELLTGQRPHRFPSGSSAEMERTIRELEPEKPSAAAGGRLRRELAGDLDNIVLTSLRKEPQRRYASAAELSEDIRRHLEALPIAAQEDRWSYRAGKFMRRNRLAVGAAALVAASLLAGIATTTIQARRAERRFQLVRELAGTLLYDLHDQVETLPGSMPVRVSIVRTVAQYLDRLAQDSGDPRLDLEIARAYFRVAAIEGHPFHANLGRTTVAREHTRKALAIFEQLTGRPETRAEAFQALVISHVEAAIVEETLGNRAAGESHLRRAGEAARQASSQYGLHLSPDSLSSLHLRLADADQHRGDIQSELANVTKAVEITGKWAEADPGQTPLNALRDASSQLANAYAHAGQLEQARDAFQDALAVSGRLLRVPGTGDKQRYGLIGVHRLFGDVLGAPDAPNLGRTAEAMAQYRAAAALGERLTERESRDLSARRNLADSYCRMGLLLTESQPAEALSYYAKANELAMELTAAEPRNTQNTGALADALIGEGRVLIRLGKNAEALRKLVRVIEIQKNLETAVPGSIWIRRGTSQAYRLAGLAHLHLGDGKQAEANYRDGLAAADRVLEKAPKSLYHHLDRADQLEAFGDYYLRLAAKPGTSREDRGKWLNEARSWYQKSLAIWQDWKARGLAAEFAGRRLNAVKAALERSTPTN